MEANSRLAPILDILPAIPADIHVLKGRKTPREYRRLMLEPLPESDLLMLDEKGKKDPANEKSVRNPIAGWEMFFTDREEYKKQEDLLKELNPRRGFLTSYPLKKQRK